MFLVTVRLRQEILLWVGASAPVQHEAVHFQSRARPSVDDLFS